MIYKVVSLFIFFCILVVPASALTITNEDDETYVVEILQGDDKLRREEISPGEMLEDICRSGCKMRLNNGVQDAFTGDESVIIKNGTFALSG